MARARGRPSSASVPQVARADAAIGAATHRLIMWGFPTKAAHEAVARAASARGRQIGPERVKQVYRAWLEDPDNLTWRRRERYTKESLRRTLPLTAHAAGRGRSGSSWAGELARILLEDDGQWPEQPIGDAILHAEQYGPNAYELTALAAERALEQQSKRPRFAARIPRLPRRNPEPEK